MRAAAATLVALLLAAPALAQSGGLEDRLRAELIAQKARADAAEASTAPMKARAEAAEKARDALKAAKSKTAAPGLGAADKARMARLEVEAARLRARAETSGSEGRAAVAAARAQTAEANRAAAVARAERDAARAAAAEATTARDGSSAALAAAQAKNARLVALAREILARYARVGLGTVVAGHEPFLGRARVRIENEAETLGDQVYANRYDAKASAKPASAPDTPPSK